MSLAGLLSRFRHILTRLRDAQRLALKALELYAPGWLGYLLSAAVSPFFRLSARAARYSNLPLRPNLVMYESYNGRDVSCSPYALLLYLLGSKEYGHLEHVVVAPSRRHPKIQALKGHPRVRVVLPDSRDYIRYAQTCGYFINNSSYKPYLAKRPGQVYLYTWHSTLLKKLARDKGAPWEARNIGRALVAADYFISPNRYTTDILLRSHGVDGFVDGLIAEFGYPRNDLTINADVPALRASLGLGEGQRLILFAPTWRGEQFAVDTVAETLAWRAQLQSLLPGNYRVLVKFHTMVYRFIDAASRKLCAPLAVDANELLAAADALVTDYSGIFFDFLVTGKPVVFFTPDREDYQKAKNGFYLDLDSLPGPVCDGLESVARELLDAETLVSRYAGRYREFRSRYLGADDGHACQRVVDLVFKGKTDPRVYSRHSGRKRVLFYPGPLNPNGVTTSFIALLASLDYSRWDVAVLLPDDNANRGYQSRLDSRAGVFYTGVSDGFTPAEYRSHVRFIKRGVATGQTMPVAAYERTLNRVFPGISFDVAVNFHGYQPGDAARLALGARAGRRVIFLHNDLDRDRRIKQPQLHAVFSTYKYHDALFCVSEDSLAANLAGMVPYVQTTFGDDVAPKMGFAQNLIEPARIKLLSAEALPPDIPVPQTDAANFLTIGRLSPEKNQARLLEAFAILRPKHPSAKLYLVGDGRESASLRARASGLGLLENIVFIPFIANPYPLFLACDCFVLSSDIEGQPITVLEAMTLGRPIIATDIPGPRDLLKGGYGRLVAPSPAAIAEAMDEFIAAGKQMERKTFDAQGYVAKAGEEFMLKVLGS